jgi:hypothetical protein
MRAKNRPRCGAPGPADLAARAASRLALSPARLRWQALARGSVARRFCRKTLMLRG